MISHEYKCIFIHIPRTAGSSLESAIIKKDWWRIEPETKHIYASTAKRIYAEYWDEYFKFSFVRNPWSRMLSMSKYGVFYGCHKIDNTLNFDSYIKKLDRFNNFEIDPRSKTAKENFKEFNRIDNSIYLNILNEELNFIGKFENLDKDFEFIANKIGLDSSILPHKEKGKKSKNDYSKFYNLESQQLVANLYEKDINYFNYTFEQS